MTKPMTMNAVNRANRAIKALQELRETVLPLYSTFHLEINGMIKRLKKEINKK